MAKRRGNPNWGKPEPIGPVDPIITSFELAVKEYKLTPDQYIRSTRLREWARRNKNNNGNLALPAAVRVNHSPAMLCSQRHDSRRPRSAVERADNCSNRNSNTTIGDGDSSPSLFVSAPISDCLSLPLMSPLNPQIRALF